jgi:hypothetical protein
MGFVVKKVVNDSTLEAKRSGIKEVKPERDTRNRIYNKYSGASVYELNPFLEAVRKPTLIFP